MSFCSSGQTEGQNQANNNQWMNALGPSSIGPNGKPIFSPSGAAQLGQQELSYLGSYLPQANQAGQAYASGLQSAASNPGWGAAQTNATNTAAGDYLAGSPQLNRALAQNQAVAGAAAGDAAARDRSEMAKNGMAWSTQNQEAQQGAQAQANEAAANTNAQSYLQNYQAERGAQNQAGNMLAQATGTPLSYLGGVGGAYSSGLAPAAQLTSGLGGGGQIYSGGTTGYNSGTYDPSAGSDVLNTIGSL